MNLEATLDLKVPKEDFTNIEVAIIFEKSTRASVLFYESDEDETEENFVRIQTRKFIPVRWKDEFMVNNPKNNRIMALGKVLDPAVKKNIPKDVKKHTGFLKKLNKSEDDMIFALAKKKGIQGLNQTEILDFSRLSKKQIMHHCQSLEKEKKIRIVSFNPVLIISRESFDLLTRRILLLIESCDKSKKKKNGLSLEEIKKEIDAHPKVIELTAGYLKYLNRINELDNKLILSPPEENISREDERIIRKMDEMCRNGEFKKYSFEKLPEMFGISSERFDRLFDVLLRRKKVIHGRDGFIFFSDWLDRLIFKLQKSKSKKITVSEFKRMSGLSRKYAIPLLELLDEKGVTRREGSIHRIL